MPDLQLVTLFLALKKNNTLSPSFFLMPGETILLLALLAHRFTVNALSKLLTSLLTVTVDCCPSAPTCVHERTLVKSKAPQLGVNRLERDWRDDNGGSECVAFWFYILMFAVSIV